MKDYSIENSTRKIHSEKTKKYFKEVSSSYYNGNYRAAVVTLYSVVITDILTKLESLNEIYEDETSKKILEEIKNSQEKNPTSPDWERHLIDEVYKRTNLIDNVDYAHLNALKDDRHLCAHPVLGKDDNLYTPSAENVASHIRNMLESLFTKPPILSKKILQTILIDIANKKDILIYDADFRKYVQAKYLDALTPTVEITIFRDLWKFVFNMVNKDAEENRSINFKLLSLLYDRNQSACTNKIKGEKEYFSNINNAITCLTTLIKFLMKREFLYQELKEDAQTLIKTLVDSDSSSAVAAWFLNESIPKHFQFLGTWVTSYKPNFDANDVEPRALSLLFEVSLERGFKQELVDFVTNKYKTCSSYNDADFIFSNMIYPYLPIFNESDFTTLCQGANSNGQAYNRKQAVYDHYEMKEFINNEFDEFDFTKYPNVFRQ